jgi:hypothetical protein
MKLAKAVLAACVGTAAFSGAVAQSQQRTVKNIVLVHGAFADGISL